MIDHNCYYFSILQLKTVKQPIQKERIRTKEKQNPTKHGDSIIFTFF